METTIHKKFVMLGAGLALACLCQAASAEDWGKYQVGDARSGYTYATAETRAIQDDDFENPAMITVDDGEQLWNAADGGAGKSCASCHHDAGDTMKAAGVSFPKFDAKLGKMKSLEQQVNICREQRMQAKPYKWESNEMLAMTTYVRHQSRGMSMRVKIDGPAAPFYEKGKAFYTKRRGLLDMACTHCHVDNAGVMIRANRLTQGQSNGFPTYRLKWQKVGSIHRRFRGCNKNIRAKPYGYGSDEYVNLELFVAARGNGLPVETPAIRN